MITMSTVQRKEPNFLIPGWLPTGTISLGYGEGGIGKSTVLLDLAASLSKGQPFNNFRFAFLQFCPVNFSHLNHPLPQVFSSSYNL